ncbi:hypothetical protein DL98DRAFT_119921 [Cadophora sp. DSE1049]|nr:hypothetical protein DL98DRAFT_119921 [Cadophora sp. DSE1049]
MGSSSRQDDKYHRCHTWCSLDWPLKLGDCSSGDLPLTAGGFGFFCVCDILHSRSHFTQRHSAANLGVHAAMLGFELKELNVFILRRRSLCLSEQNENKYPSLPDMPADHRTP